MLGHSNYNNRIISIVSLFFGTPCTGCIKKTQPRNFLRNTLQFLSIKDFRPLGIEIELLIQGVPKKSDTIEIILLL